jgi:hypothetical protein
MKSRQQTSHPGNLREWDDLFSSLPGGELVRKGIADLQRGAKTVPALLLLIGGTRLRNLGLLIPPAEGHPEHMLYDLLSKDDPDSAHSRYNALIRLLVSFERAASCVRK